MSSSHCNYCGSALPPQVPSETDSEMIRQLLVSGRRVQDCLGCGATVRARQVRFYLERSALLQGRSQLRILHFSPEPVLVNYLATLAPEIHVLAVPQVNADRRYEQIEIENIPYDDGTFDLVIADGLLECVQSVERALQEINRVLKFDGLAVLQTSFSHVLHTSWEDPGLDCDALRTMFYGDATHRRLFGGDVVARMEQHLNGQVLGSNQLAPDAESYGLDLQEPFFLFRKRGAWTLPKPVQPFCVDDEPVSVSILCLTYNHAAFITQTLEGFLSQRTRFRFEIVVGEDCSSDDTLARVQPYAQRHPNLIKVLSGPVNLGMHRNFLRTLQACSGRYIALCEGDDYWTDPLKLQKQFDYLEQNPDCAIVYGSVQAHQDGHIVYDYSGGAKLDLPAALLQRSPAINTLTTMFRNLISPLPTEILACGAGDMFLWSLLGQHGHGHYMPSLLPSIYNMHAGGAHSLTGNANQLRLRLKTFYAAFHYYARVGDSELAEYFLQGVARDAEQIAHLVTPHQACALLQPIPEEMARATDALMTLDTHALSTIVASVLTSRETLHVD